MGKFKLYCEIIVSRGVVLRALKVALIVGTTLNLINQGETITAFDFSNLNLTKFFLTFIVPYSVTTYTAVSLKLEFQIGTKATVDADLECKSCGATIHVNKGSLIPECPKCGVKTHWKLTN